MSHHDPVDHFADLHGASADDLGIMLDVEAGLREIQIAAQHAHTVRDLKLDIGAGLHAIVPTADLHMSRKPTQPADVAPAEQTTRHRKGHRRARKPATMAAAAVLLMTLGIGTGIGAAQSTRLLPHHDKPAAQPARPSPVAGPRVALLWQGDKLTIRWTDPSDGDAQPILFGSVRNGVPQQLSELAVGDTQATILGLSRTAIYCLAVVLVYMDNSVLLSDRVLPSDLVCTERPPARKVGRLEAHGG